jgi:hypothetical protein
MEDEEDEGLGFDEIVRFGVTIDSSFIKRRPPGS